MPSLRKTPEVAAQDSFQPNHFKEAIVYLRRACSRAPVLIDLAKGQEVRRKHKIQGSQGTLKSQVSWTFRVKRPEIEGRGIFLPLM